MKGVAVKATIEEAGLLLPFLSPPSSLSF